MVWGGGSGGICGVLVWGFDPQAGKAYDPVVVFGR